MSIIALKRSLLACIASAVLLTLSCSGGGSSSSPFVITNGSGTVSGIVRYQDKEYDRNGFTGTNPFKTVRFATVEVVDSSTSKVLASGITGADGAYSLSYSGAGSNIFVRVLAQAEMGGAARIQVMNLGGFMYAVGSGSFASGGTSIHNIDIDLVSYSQVSAAYNILDVLTTGMQFVQGIAGTYPPQLSTFWEYNSGCGTFYGSGSICLSQGLGIYILGVDSGGDTDGYDDDVILHEFGHFLADNFSRDDSPGGAHYLGENREDLRLSWSEGWGNFIPLAIRYWQTANDPTRISSVDSSPSIYVDTVGNLSFIVYDTGNPVSTINSYLICFPNLTTADCFSYSSNELAIANVLWNTMTGVGNFGMQPIWSTISSWHNLSAANLAFVNLEAFWDTWISQRSPGAGELNTLWTIYGNDKIYYREDPYEPDNSIAAVNNPILAGVTNGQTHYLYRSDGLDDSDFYAFSTGAANNISVATSGLANGADTFINVYGELAGNYTVIASNDNANGLSYVKCIANSGPSCYDYYYIDTWGFTAYAFPLNDDNVLSSRAAFNSPSGAANYLIEVKPSPNRPDSAGRYGTYTLTITSQ